MNRNKRERLADNLMSNKVLSDSNKKKIYQTDPMSLYISNLESRISGIENALNLDIKKSELEPKTKEDAAELISMNIDQEKMKAISKGYEFTFEGEKYRLQMGSFNDHFSWLFTYATVINRIVRSDSTPIGVRTLENVVIKESPDYWADVFEGSYNSLASIYESSWTHKNNILEILKDESKTVEDILNYDYTID